MKWIFAILFTIICFSCKAHNEQIYFSYNSSANIIFSISNDKTKGTVIISGKKQNGFIQRNSNSSGFYDFISDDKLVFLFEIGDKEIVIVNQKYEIEGANEKAIELRLINRPDNLRLLYEDVSNYIIDDISLMNDKAYYLEQVGAYEEAIYILNKIIIKEPGRVVAYLNLGDAQWGINKKLDAKKSYEKYVELMKIQGKNIKKIPQRAYDRIK